MLVIIGSGIYLSLLFNTTGSYEAHRYPECKNQNSCNAVCHHFWCYSGNAISSQVLLIHKSELRDAKSSTNAITNDPRRQMTANGSH